MAVEKGRGFLLKVGTAAAGTTLAGCRTTSMSIGNDAVDITNKDSAGFMTLLEAAGTQKLSISAEGVFDPAGGGQSTIEGYVMAKSINAFGLAFDGGKEIDGNFLITSYELSGNHDGEVTFSISLESSGAFTIT